MKKIVVDSWLNVKSWLLKNNDEIMKRSLKRHVIYILLAFLVCKYVLTMFDWTHSTPF